MAEAGRGNVRGYGLNYLPGVDLELRVGGSGEQQQAMPGMHLCSYCDKAFASLQALGGHQTAHRKEIEEMRRRHDAMIGGQKRVTFTPAIVTTTETGAGEGSGATVNLELTLGRAEDKIDLSLKL